jgi:hypothetical protein
MPVISVTTVGFREVRDLDASACAWTMIMSGTGSSCCSGRWAS